METIKHTVNGREYEIRYMQTDEKTTVGIFSNGKRLATYPVDAETMKDSKDSTVPQNIGTLIELAKSDLDQGIVK